MYKRIMHGWGLYKNKRSKFQASTSAQRVNATIGKETTICCYFQQNEFEESLNLLWHLFSSWIDHADIIWDAKWRMLCPPRAAYIYDDFIHNIGAAVSAFDSGQVVSGGASLRRAFIHLEATLLPKSRSVYSLDSLFFALATLNQANLHKACRLLISHAAKLVAIRTQPLISNTKTCMRTTASVERPLFRTVLQGYDGEHRDHPFSQILLQLHFLATQLDNDDNGLTHLVYRAWSAYHRLASKASAKSVSSRALQRDYWQMLLRKYGDRIVPGFVTMKEVGWNDIAPPVFRLLFKLLAHAEKNSNGDMSLLILNEIIAVYSYSHCEEFEEAALSFIGALEKRFGKPGTDDAVILEERGSYVAFELCGHYVLKKDFSKAVKYMCRVFPPKVRPEGEALFGSELQSWVDSRANRPKYTTTHVQH